MRSSLSATRGARTDACQRARGVALKTAEAPRTCVARPITVAAVSTMSNVMGWIAEARIDTEAAGLFTLHTAWLINNEGGCQNMTVRIGAELQHCD